VTLPFFILQGKEDKVINTASAQRFFDQAASKDKKLQYYEGAWHLLWFEKCKDIVYKDVEEWIEKRLGKNKNDMDEQKQE